MIEDMAQVHMSEAELARDLHAVLEQVRQGAEVIVERDFKTGGRDQGSAVPWTSHQ